MGAWPHQPTVIHKLAKAPRSPSLVIYEAGSTFRKVQEGTVLSPPNFETAYRPCHSSEHPVYSLSPPLQEAPSHEAQGIW